MRSPHIALCLLLALGEPALLALPQGDGGRVLCMAANKKKVLLKVNLESEAQLQKEVDNGHQPWRLVAVDVAAATLSRFEKRDVSPDECTLESSTDEEAIVRHEGQRSYRVRLKRLVKPQGIWTAVEIEIM